MKKVAFIFPGQGSQSVGMGKAISEAYPQIRESLAKADDILGDSLSTLMFHGPTEDLTNTENAQPALLLTSALICDILNEQGIYPVVTAGHSLGEYSALVQSGSISLEEALPLVRARGQLMEEAYPKGKGAMAAVLGAKQEKIKEVIEEVDKETEDVVDVANLNCPGQVVISGTKQGIELASEKLKQAGKKVIPLNVSGPFHSRLMKPAAEKFSEVLNSVQINDAKIPIYANVTAEKVNNSQEITDLLIKQLYSPVRFEEIIEHLLEEELDAIIEVGNGKVLSGLVRKVNRRMKTFAVQDPESIQTFVEWYKEES